MLFQGIANLVVMFPIIFEESISALTFERIVKVVLNSLPKSLLIFSIKICKDENERNKSHRSKF